MPRALIYTRVSSDHAGRGRSVKEQRMECERECQRHDPAWEVVEVLTDNDIGASKFSKRARPEWARVKTLLGSGDIDVLVTWEASRAQRDLGAYIDLRKLCIATKTLWSYNGRTYDMADGDDAYRTGSDALDAEREAALTSKRVKRAMAAAAAAGKPHGRKAFGYARVYDVNTRELLAQEPHAEQAPIVVEIIERIIAGESLRTLTTDFNCRGLVTGTNAPWQPTAVKRIAVNPAYAGLRVHQGKVVGDGDWPPLVSRTAHESAVAILTNPARLTARQRERRHLLSGIAKCGRCGSNMVVQKQRGRDNYICRKYQHLAVAKDALDALVLRVLFERFELAGATGDLAADVPDAVLNVRSDLEEMRARLATAAEEYAAGRLSAAMLAHVDAKITSEIDAAQRALQRAPIPSTVAAMAEASDGAAFWTDKLTLEQRVEVIRALFNVTVNPSQRVSKVFDPSRVDISFR